MTIISTPLSKYLKISSFTVNDFPAPDVAKITLFMFGSWELNLSKITNPPVWELIPYIIPVLVIKSLEIKGKLAASEEVTALLTIPKLSWQIGKFAQNHSSILWIAFLTLIPYPAIFCSNFFPVSLSFSSEVS